MTEHYVLAAQKVNSVLGCNKTSVGSGLREGILPLCSGETHLESYIQLWNPQLRKDMELLE